MRHPILLGLVTLLGSLAADPLRANETLAAPPPQAPAQAPAKDYWPDCVDYTCKIVTEQKPIKKTVYECREVPFCLHMLPKLGHCDCCPQCGCVRFKKVLIKKEIIVGYECITRCVPEALPPCGPLKSTSASAPLVGSYYDGGDQTHLPQAVVPPPASSGLP
jgi:hypothetical protein